MFSAVYLAYCRVFVTSNGGHVSAMRTVAELSGTECGVLMFPVQGRVSWVTRSIGIVTSAGAMQNGRGARKTDLVRYLLSPPLFSEDPAPAAAYRGGRLLRWSREVQ